MCLRFRGAIKKLAIALMIANLAQPTILYATGMDNSKPLNNTLEQPVSPVGNSQPTDIESKEGNQLSAESLEGKDSTAISPAETTKPDSGSIKPTSEESIVDSSKEKNTLNNQTGTQENEVTSLQGEANEEISMGIVFNGDFDLKYMTNPEIYVYDGMTLVEKREIASGGRIEIENLQKKEYTVIFKYSDIEGVVRKIMQDINLSQSNDVKIDTGLLKAGDTAVYISDISKRLTLKDGSIANIEVGINSSNDGLEIRSNGVYKDFVMSVKIGDTVEEIESNQTNTGYESIHSIALSKIETNTIEVKILYKDKSEVSAEGFSFDVKKVNMAKDEPSFLDKILSIFKVSNSNISIVRMKQGDAEFVNAESVFAVADGGKTIITAKNISVKDEEKYFKENYIYAVTLPDGLDIAKFESSAADNIRMTKDGEVVYLFEGYNTYDYGRGSAAIEVDNEVLNKYLSENKSLKLSVAIVDVNDGNNILTREDYAVTLDENLPEGYSDKVINPDELKKNDDGMLRDITPEIEKRLTMINFNGVKIADPFNGISPFSSAQFDATNNTGIDQSYKDYILSQDPYITSKTKYSLDGNYIIWRIYIKTSSGSRDIPRITINSKDNDISSPTVYVKGLNTSSDVNDLGVNSNGSTYYASRTADDRVDGRHYYYFFVTKVNNFERENNYTLDTTVNVGNFSKSFTNSIEARKKKIKIKMLFENVDESHKKTIFDSTVVSLEQSGSGARGDAKYIVNSGDSTGNYFFEKFVERWNSVSTGVSYKGKIDEINLFEENGKPTYAAEFRESNTKELLNYGSTYTIFVARNKKLSVTVYDFDDYMKKESNAIKLKGGKFSLLVDAGGEKKEVISDLSADENGKIVIDGLPGKKYYLRETLSPKLNSDDSYSARIKLLSIHGEKAYENNKPYNEGVIRNEHFSDNDVIINYEDIMGKSETSVEIGNSKLSYPATGKNEIPVVAIIVLLLSALLLKRITMLYSI